MPSKISSYELSSEAEKDLSDIFDYTEGEFGFDQAVIYLSEFSDMFQYVVDNPELGRERPEIRVGLRSVTANSHVVMYRVLKDRIRIVRVLHGSRDLKQNFKNTTV